MIENKSLKDIAHTYEKEGVILPYSTVELHKQYGLNMMDVREGLSKFMQRTGMRLNEQQLASFRRKLRSIMSYDPNARIDQFIRESVLEERKVDFSKLVEAKNNIDALNANFEIIESEIKELEEIIDLFDRLIRAQKKTASKYLKNLKEKSKIERIGSDRKLYDNRTGNYVPYRVSPVFGG